MNVRRVAIGDVHVPEDNHHFVRDPNGYKGPRDQRLIGRIERWQRRERLQKLKPSSSEDELHGPSVRQERVARQIQDALNQVMTNHIRDRPDTAARPSSRRDLVSPALRQANVQFTSVKVTPDLVTATCVWECRPSYEIEVRNALSLLKSDLRRVLAEDKLRLKRAPKLNFVFNDKHSKVENLERLFDSVDSEMAQPLTLESFGSKEQYFKEVMASFAERTGELHLGRSKRPRLPVRFVKHRPDEH